MESGFKELLGTECKQLRGLKHKETNERLLTPWGCRTLGFHFCGKIDLHVLPPFVVVTGEFADGKVAEL